MNRKNVLDDATLENLVRWVAETDRVEDEHLDDEHAAPAAPLPLRAETPRVYGAHLADAEEASAMDTADSAPRSLFRTLAPIAGLAAALVIAFLSLPSDPAHEAPPPGVVTGSGNELARTDAPGDVTEPTGAASRISIRHQANVDSTGIDRFSVVAERQCVVLALLRTWQEDCDCLEWRLHEWQGPGGDGVVHELQQPGEWIDIDLELRNTPAVEQTLIVISADSRDDLPLNDIERSYLLSCVQKSLIGEHLADLDIDAVPLCLPCDSENAEFATATFIGGLR